YLVQLRICGDRRGSEMIDVGGHHKGRASFRRGDRDETRTCAEIEHRSPDDLCGMIEDVAGKRLAAGPGESPKRRRHRAACEGFLGGLPNRSDLGGEVEVDL